MKKIIAIGIILLTVATTTGASFFVDNAALEKEFEFMSGLGENFTGTLTMEKHPLVEKVSLIASEISPSGSEKGIIDTINADDGFIRVKVKTERGTKAMVTVMTESKHYRYLIKGDDSYETLPVQMGDGIYNIELSLYPDRGLEDSTYKSVAQKTKIIDVKLKEPDAIYLASNINVNWNDSMEPIKKAKELAKGENLSNTEKVTRIYNHIIDNIKYDYEVFKQRSLPYDYTPNIENTYETKKGVCVDFSSPFAAMCRSVGVPTKYVTGCQHAWNEVYIDGEWYEVDTSYDAVMIHEEGRYTPMLRELRKSRTIEWPPGYSSSFREY